MSCERFEQLLHEDDQTPELRRHVSECRSCLELDQRLSRLDKALSFDLHIDPGYAQFRRKIILQKAQYLEPEPAPQWPLRIARFAAALVILGIFAILPYQTLDKPETSATTVDFELGKVNDRISLKWKGDPDRTYRVYRGPNPHALKLVQEIQGVQWIDTAAKSLPIVFYKVESL